MNKIAVIICYFGEKPQIFDAWEISAIQNVKIDFLFFTDIKSIRQHDNIYVKYITFSDLKALIEKKLNTKISLDHTYKLCDYRLMYGRIFSDYLKEYEFWGYCDLDIIFGKIDDFITDNILNSNQKLLQNGHFTLYKNIDAVNNLYLQDGPFPECNYKEVIHSNLSCYFDEFTGGIPKSLRCLESIYLNPASFVDISYYYYDFRDFSGKKYKYFIWDKGKLFSVDDKGKHEIMYLHVQKRSFNISQIQGDLFYIGPNYISQQMHKEKRIKILLYNSHLHIRRKFIKKKNRDYLDVKVSNYGTRRNHWRKYIKALLQECNNIHEN